uniref:Uncharacterized protein n=1 Tax=Rhizophora mucronata TaxID=61149 RepID=A0A2P2Q746_RHIMU
MQNTRFYDRNNCFLFMFKNQIQFLVA